MGSAEGGGGGGEEGTKKRMAPWEQHSAVISIPRYDYNAPASLLRHSHSGFLVTCRIKREKSATKEAMAILDKYCSATDGAGPSLSESEARDETGSANKRRNTSPDVLLDCGSGSLAKDEDGSTGDHPKGSGSPSKEADTDVGRASLLSLVKLTRSGLLLLTFPKGHSADTVSNVSEIIRWFESGTPKPPQWCHRIFPIQATCCLNEQALHTTVENLVRAFVKDKPARTNGPIKFAVGYDRRGIGETELKTSKESSQSFDSAKYPLLDRNKCFEVVGAAVNGVISDAVVDLETPEFCVLIELLPLAAVPSGSLVVAASVLPETLVTTKPRRCVKALVPDTKAKKGKS